MTALRRRLFAHFRLFRKAHLAHAGKARAEALRSVQSAEDRGDTRGKHYALAEAQRATRDRLAAEVALGMTGRRG